MSPTLRYFRFLPFSRYYIILGQEQEVWIHKMACDTSDVHQGHEAFTETTFLSVLDRVWTEHVIMFVLIIYVFVLIIYLLFYMFVQHSFSVACGSKARSVQIVEYLLKASSLHRYVRF